MDGRPPLVPTLTEVHSFLRLNRSSTISQVTLVGPESSACITRVSETIDHITPRGQTHKYIPPNMPYYGRGGAGNISAVQAASERASADLEANQSAADTSTDPEKSRLPLNYKEEELGTPSSERQYAHSGRGGAGNFYSPKELSQSGHFNDAGRSNILGQGTMAPSELPGQRGEGESMIAGRQISSSAPSTAGESTRTYGRGGAGNYAFGISESEERTAKSRLEDDEKQSRLKQDIENGVKEQIAFPQKAKLPGGEPY